MTPRVHVYTICKNEARMMPFFLRHYSTFAEQIVIYDEQSDDGTRDAIKACPKAELREWPHRGLDDDKFLAQINRVGPETEGLADWVIFADVDELLYHPEILRVLRGSDEDMIASTGYALISPDGFPADDGRQLYESVKTGIRQSNYDKFICWRPAVRVEHTIGRHTYGIMWPKCEGVRGVDSKLKLLHCHHIGGVEYTREINQRNYDRAVEKRFAWSYSVGHNENPEQNGSLAWVRDAIKNHRLTDVVSSTRLRKMQFGSGSNWLDGWENYDSDVDISKPLRFQDNCASSIFAEHVIEHVTHKEAWLFLAECWRVLAPGGVVRIAIPDLCRMSKHMTHEYADVVKKGGHGDGTFRSALKACVFEHGHQSAWTATLLSTFLTAVGFKATLCRVGQSKHVELRGIEGHGKVVGDEVARIETSVVEGVKV